MYTRVVEATEEHEPGVRALFESVGMTVRERAWARAFNHAAPGGHAGAPWIVAGEDARVLAFVVARPQRIFYQGNSYRAQILYDFMVAQDDDGLQAGTLLLETVCQRSSLNLAAGWGIGPLEIIRGLSWKHIANMPRWRIRPPRRRTREGNLPAELEPPEDPAPVQSAMAAEGTVFFERARLADRFLSTAEGEEYLTLPLPAEIDEAQPGAFVRLRHVESSHPGEREWHVVDFRGTGLHRAKLVRTLAEIASRSGEDVYLSCLNKHLDPLLQEAGAEELQPRWGVFARLGDLSLRDVILTLNVETKWNLFPADFDLDVEC